MIERRKKLELKVKRLAVGYIMGTVNLIIKLKKSLMAFL